MPPWIRTNSSSLRPPGLTSALAVFVVAATASLWAGHVRPFDGLPGHADARLGTAGLESGRPTFVPDGGPLFSRQSPPILRPDYTGNVQVEVVYVGTLPHLRVFESRNGGTSHVFDEFPQVETRVLGGRTVSVFRPSWTMGEFVKRFGLVIDFDSGIGARLLVAPSTVPLGPNGAPTIGDRVFVRAMSTTVKDVPVVQIDATAQYSSHVVNLVVPALAGALADFDAFPSDVAAKRFYSYFGDDYEHLAFVFREEPISRATNAAFHVTTQNQISGIGMPVFNVSATWGSAGRLEGVEQYVHTLDNAISNHELGHQWGHYFNWAGIAGISHPDSAHGPLWGHHEATMGAFIAPNLKLLPLGGLQWEAVLAAEPTRAAPLELYAMGRLAANAVPSIEVFENQNRPTVNVPGERASGTTRLVTMNDIIAFHGPRLGPTIQTLRRALILVSREALATPAEMAYWTLLAQRLEDPQQTGVINESGIGSFRAVTGATLNTRIIPPAAGAVLAGHTTLEPDVLDVRDLAGVVVDAAPRFELPSSGIFRLQGRIVDPALAGASRIAVRNGGNPKILSSSVAPDGSFSITGSPDHGTGRYTQTLFVTIDGLDRNIAGMRNVRYFGGLRVPPPPVALKVTSSANNVSIQWSPDTGSPPSSYFLDVGSSPGASDLGSLAVGATTLSTSGVPNGRYYLRVRAANAAGVSAPSAEAVLTVGCAAPLPPGTLTGAVHGASVTLSWQPSPTSGVSYTLVAGSTTGASNIAQVPVGVVTSISGAVPSGRYFFRVRAVTPCGASESNEVEIVVGLPQPPGAPGPLTSQVAAGTVSLAWQAAAGTVAGYVLEVGSRPTLADLAAAPVGTVLSFSAGGVPPGTYYVRVRAFNATGLGPPSNEVTLVVP